MDYIEHKKEIQDRCDLLIAHCKSLLSFMYNPKEGLEEIISSIDHTKELADKLTEASKGLNGVFTHDTSVAMGIKTILTEIEYDVTKIGLAYGNILAHTEKESNNVVRRNEAMVLNSNTVMNKLLLDRIKSNKVLLAYANDKLETSYKQLNPEIEAATDPKKTLYLMSSVCKQFSSDLAMQIESLLNDLTNKAELLNNLDTQDKGILDYSVYDKEEYKDTFINKFKEQCVQPNDVYNYIIEIVKNSNVDGSKYENYIQIVEHIDNEYIDTRDTVTETIKRFKDVCVKIEELVKTFTESNQKVLDLSTTMSNNQMTNEEYIKNIEDHIFRITVFTKLVLETLNITLNTGYVLDYISKAVNNLFLTTVNTFNMVE